MKIETLEEESCVIVKAEVIEEERAKVGYELRMVDIEILSVPSEPSPIVINQKKVDTSLENLLDYRPVTLRNEKERAIFKLQKGIAAGFRQFLMSQGFTEIPSVKFIDAKQMVSEAYNREIRDYEDFEPEEEKLLCELIQKETGSEFVFVTHYPSKKRPFYAMENPENTEETLSFDLLFRGLEITTGGQRIHNYEEQLAKLRRRGMEPEHFAGYLMAHKCGLSPHGGLGLGLERFTAKLLGFENVKNATLFPRDINRLVP